METRKTPLALTASALAMALMLVGCGGGSSSSTPQPTVAAPTPPTTPPPTTPPPAPPETVDLPTSTYLTGDNVPMALADMASVAIAATGTDVGAYTLTCTSTEACAVEVKNGVITVTSGEVASPAAFNAIYMKKIDDAEMAEMKMEEQKPQRATGLFNALLNRNNVHDRRVSAPRLGLSNTFDITRELTGDAMVIRNRAGWDDMMDAASLGADGWSGKVLSDGKMQRITVYTNIENAKPAAFTSRYDAPLPAGAPALPTGITSDADSKLTITATGMVTAGNLGLLNSEHFPQPKGVGKGTTTYTYDDTRVDAGKDEIRNKTFKGTFQGATGKYECTDSTCTIVRTSSSSDAALHQMYSPGTGAWTFTPDTNAQVQVQDSDYLYFGWWVKEPEKATSGQFLYDVQVFAHGIDPFTAGDVDALQGKADYKGPAAGLYAVKANEDAGTAAAHGEFMADATLAADFDNNNTPGTLSGKIDKFRGSSAGVDMSKWALSLDEVTFASNMHAGNNGVVGGASVNDGNWTYELLGSSTNSKLPSGIAGTFNARIDNDTAVAGAFGATLQ